MARKTIIFSFAILMSGCALTPKPLQLLPSSVPFQNDSSRKGSIEVVYPNRFRILKLRQKSLWTGFLNTLEIELGKDVYQTINSQLSNYYKNVIFSENKSTKENAVIKITNLYGSIDKNSLSVDVNVEVELFLPGKSSPIQRNINSKGQGSSVSTLLGGALIAGSILTKAEHEALQGVINQFVPIIQLAFNANEKINPPPNPPNLKSIKNSAAKNIPKETFVAPHRTTGTSVRKKKVTARKPTGIEVDQVQSGRTASGRYYALVIGNNNYRHISKLETAKKDAKDVAATLKQKYGFQVKLLLNATRRKILHAINDFRRRLTEKDNFLIYYAGHGKLDEASNKAYWLPIDALPDDDTSWIIADTITSNIKRISANHILVVADSCYSGTLTRSSLPDLSRGHERAQYLRKMRKKPSRTLLASGGNEPVADGGGNGHSVFAEAFLQGLKNIDSKIFSVEELFYRGIKERVAGNADQTPEYKVIRNSGHDGGDFVFERVASK